MNGSTTSVAPAQKPDHRYRSKLSHRLINHQTVLTLIGVVIFVFFALFATHFTEKTTLYDILRTSAFTVIIGLPLTYLLIVGEFDLSVGPNYALCAVMTGIAITNWHMNPWLGAGLAVLAGLTIGVINAVVTLGVGVPSFITTLGMLNVAGGLAVILTGGLPIVLPPSASSGAFAELTGGTVAGVPIQILWAAVAFAIAGFVLRQTIFGAHVYATGDNRLAAIRLGVKTARVKAACFMLVGLSCGVAGALTTGWLQSASAATGSNSTLNFYAAVILGGVALNGGEGTAYGTVVGALIIGMLSSGLVLLGAQGSWVQLIQGLLIVLAGIGQLIARPESPLATSVIRAWHRVRHARAPLT